MEDFMDSRSTDSEVMKEPLRWAPGLRISARVADLDKGRCRRGDIGDRPEVKAGEPLRRLVPFSPLPSSDARRSRSIESVDSVCVKRLLMATLMRHANGSICVVYAGNLPTSSST